MSRKLAVGDEAILHVDGCLPNRVVVTAIAADNVTHVRFAEPSSWATVGPGEFVLEHQGVYEQPHGLLLYPVSE